MTISASVAASSRSYARRRNVASAGVKRWLESRRDALGLDGPLWGYWHDARNGSAAQLLEIRAGDLPFAELVDLDGDGRVDMALVLEP